MTAVWIVAFAGAGNDRRSAAAASPAAPSMTVVVVPFAPPGNSDYQLDAATHDFTTRLATKSWTVVESKAMDAIDVGESANDLRKRYSASAIFVGTVRHEPTHNVFLGTNPTHAEVRVTELSCDGKTKWKGVGIGDKVQYWSNPAAAVTNVIQMALDRVISEMP